MFFSKVQVIINGHFKMYFRRCFSKKVSCPVCTTINIANKFTEPIKRAGPPCNPNPCLKYCETPIQPTCIKICSTKKECLMKQTGKKPYVPPKPYYVHGKLLWGVKSAILAGTVLFTIQQGVWGDQVETMECVARWGEYAKSLTKRSPPKFDKCGRVQISSPPDPYDGFFGPIWEYYKGAITTCFNGVVKMPLIIKCAYLNYQEELEKFKLEREAEVKAMKKK